MDNFTYYRPKSAELAVALLDEKWGTAELLGGGTDLLSLQKQYIARPRKVVSLATVPGLDKIEQSRGWPMTIKIGAGVKLATLAASQALVGGAAALAQAADEIAGPQIRNMGTLGGSLCQRNRCWYFRDEPTVCLLKGGDKCFALDGENRYHAIFTKGHRCVISSPTTIGTALIALGATATVLGPKGKRTIKMAEFFKAPTGPGDREHVLAANEMLLGVEFSLASDKARSASYEVRQKLSSDWPLVQASVAFDLEGGKATNVRVALGHVAPTPLLSEAAAKAIEGKEITEETAAAAGEAATQGAKPLSQNAYKVKLLAVAVKRALLLAAGGKKYWEVALPEPR
ncbi:MAG: FAD binding domain-containing protein [Gemmataceae bacterium]